MEILFAIVVIIGTVLLFDCIDGVKTRNGMTDFECKITGVKKKYA